MEIKTVPFEKIKPGAKCLIPENFTHRFSGYVVRKLWEPIFSGQVVGLIKTAVERGDHESAAMAEKMTHNIVYKGETSHLFPSISVIPIKES